MLPADWTDCDRELSVHGLVNEKARSRSLVATGGESKLKLSDKRGRDRCGSTDKGCTHCQ